MTFLRISAAATIAVALGLVASDAAAVPFTASDTEGPGINTFDSSPITFTFLGVPSSVGNPGTIRIQARGDIGLPAISETIDVEIDNGVDPAIMFGFVFLGTVQAGISTDDRLGDETKPILPADLLTLTSTGTMNVTLSFNDGAGGIDESFISDFVTATIEYETIPPIIPEPSAAGLGVLGLLLLSITPRRRRRASR